MSSRSSCSGLAAAFLALACLLAAGTGCSKGAGCDPACAAGNQCIDDGSGSGPACHRTCVAQSDCPANWTCNDGNANSGGVSWCVQNTATYPSATGEWHATCRAAMGEGANPDCDWDLGFACYATSPTDANAFCTQFACTGDGDCPGGWWCATENVGPNATSSAPTFGKTRTVCLPRTYCAPCKKDLDCYAPAGSTPMHCVPGSNGVTFCAPECGGDSNCQYGGQYDSACTNPWKVCSPSTGGAACTRDDDCPTTATAYQHCLGGHCTPECGSAADCAGDQTCVTNVKVCLPRAGVCVGDGSFCSPCRSDDDCAPKTTGAVATPRPPGYCVSSATFGESYSTERFCTAPATVPDCDAMAGDPVGCPQPQPGQNWKVTACTTAPANQCIGVVSFGTSTGTPTGIPGCWTVNR